MLLGTLTFVLLAILALGFQVFALAPERNENRAFAAFAWISAVWVFNDLSFWGFHGPDEDGRGWAKAALLIAIAMQLGLLHFASRFPRPRPLARATIAALVLPGAPVVAAVLAGRAVGRAGFVGGRFSLELLPWTYAAGAYIYVLFVVGAGKLALSRASLDDARLRRQVDFAVAAPVVTGLLTSIGIVLFPLAHRFELLPYASLGILIGIVVHAYAQWNLRFLVPESALEEVRLFPVTAKLSLAVAVATLAGAAVVLAVSRAVVGPAASLDAWRRATALSLAAASLPAMGLIFLAQRILTRPLRAITEAALAVAGGRTDVRVASGARDEVGVLAAAFNDMVERLERDMEALRETSEGLLRTERLATAGALAAGVAHEVNNPLAAVSSLVQAARARTDDPRSKELLDQATLEMDRVAGTLRDLLELARPRERSRRLCDLNAIAESTVRILRYDKRFRKVSLSLEAAGDLPPLDADPDRLQQVLLNLLLNARDAVEGKDGASVSLGTRRGPGASVELEVADNGRGIAPADLARVFEPFFTTKPAGTGTGLGLAVCRDIVREHGGTIAIDSQPEKGTRVKVVLPAHDEGSHAEE